MKDCKDKVEIHSEARKIDVTPSDERGKKDDKRPRMD
jgi:hypothetical protein